MNFKGILYTKRKKPTKAINARIDADIWYKFKEICKEHNCKMSPILTKLVTKFIKDITN